jgi:hypothetical protein
MYNRTLAQQEEVYKRMLAQQEKVYKGKLNKNARKNASAMAKKDEEVKHLVSTDLVLARPWRTGRARVYVAWQREGGGLHGVTRALSGGRGDCRTQLVCWGMAMTEGGDMQEGGTNLCAWVLALIHLAR